MRQRGLPYESATSGDKALAESQRILESFGCVSFGTMIDNEKQAVIVAFKWHGRNVQLEASWKGYAKAWLKRHPYDARRMRRTGNEHDARALEQGRIAVCSMLRDWIKGQVTAVECGILSFDAVFYPHVLLPSGKRLIDRVDELRLLESPQ
jgi:hypothetical protein